jgi:hypothetical protein
VCRLYQRVVSCFGSHHASSDDEAASAQCMCCSQLVSTLKSLQLAKQLAIGVGIVLVDVLMIPLVSTIVDAMILGVVCDNCIKFLVVSGAIIFGV